MCLDADMTDQIENARVFASLHIEGDPVILPNVWDAMSARIVAASGARAIATTSAGIAWSLGCSDGNHLSREAALDAVSRILDAVTLPVTADIEGGYGLTPGDVGRTVALFVEAGVVGINIEDSLRPIGEQQLRIAAARVAAERANLPLFINARIDTHKLAEIGSSAWLEETVTRAQAYEDAGASGVFALGALRAESIKALAGATPMPVNVAFGPGTLPLAELAGAGASRISAGSSIVEAAYSMVADLAATMIEKVDAREIPTPGLSWNALNQLIP